MCVKKENVMTSVLLAVPLLFHQGLEARWQMPRTASKSESEKKLYRWL